MPNLAIRFGRADHLVGIIHEPEADIQAFGILLWNTGISHRIGPFRVHYEIGEMLQKLGYPVLRFDLSRLGDSDEAESDLNIQDIFTLDIADGIKTLEQRYAIKKFVLIGICSGAVDAWYYARQDSRVVGLCMVDTFVYPTFAHRWISLIKRASSPRRWRRLLTRFFTQLKSKPKFIPLNDYLDSNYPLQSEANRDTKSMIERGLQLFVLYTGGFSIWYSYRRQFKHMLAEVDFKDQLQLISWPKVDHLFTLLEDRQLLLAQIERWCKEKFCNQSRGLPHFTDQQKIMPCPEPIQQQLQSAAPSVKEAPLTDSPTVLAVFQEVLHPIQLEMDDSFFDFGGNSILAIKCIQQLGVLLNRDIPITLIYLHRSAIDLATALNSATFTPRIDLQASKLEEPAQVSQHAIAIIGMACKVPGAKNIQEFWELIQEGRTGLTRFRPEDLDPSLPPSMVNHPNYVPVRGVIDADRFDHEFFAMNRQESLMLDPQQRVLMETCWQALEASGWAHRRQSVRVGVYVGVGNSSYLSRNIMQGHAEPHSEEEYLAMLANDKDYVATRIAYQLDLRGPAVSVHTACSTSLVAVIEGIKTLLTNDADLIIAGAAAVNSPIASGHLYQDGAIFSKDGQCRPFAAEATGTVFSDGSAVVVLKRLDRALADGDLISAVIHGWGINNDGRDKSSFAAPSIKGQAEAIGLALKRAHWNPRSISYVECHGTATPIGDPIEVEGLRRAYQAMTSETNFCALGSVKANIGHLTAAAGTIGLIKAALAVRDGVLPAALFSGSLNPELRLDQSPFYVPSKTQKWPAGGPRRAGISSFGVGGTNSHILIEAAPAHRPVAENSQVKDPWQTLTWSAKDQNSALRFGRDLLPYLPSEYNQMADLSYTLLHLRPRYGYRLSVTAVDAQKLREKLSSFSETPQFFSGSKKAVVLMFPGQASQYLKMGLDLARAWPRFAAHYLRAIQAFERNHGLDLQTAIDDDEQQGEGLLHRTQYTQPGIFSLEWALAQSLIEVGLPISGLLGHSIGELSAACIAQVLTFDDAIKLVYHRARIMQSVKNGSMLAVRATKEKIKDFLVDGLEISVINGPENCIVGGDSKLFDSLKASLKTKSIAFKQLESQHAFHTFMMDPVLAEFRDAIKDIHLHPPQIPIISTVDGKILTAARACSHEYWVEQIRRPVNFAAALAEAAKIQDSVFLEVGPRDALTRFAKQNLRDESRWPSLALLPKNVGLRGEEFTFAEAIDQLANLGFDLFVAKHGRNISAPTYSFQGERLWIAPLEKQSGQTAPGSRSVAIAPIFSSALSALKTGEDHWLANLTERLGQLSGLNPLQLNPEQSWNSLGLDSLLLTQWALKLQKEWQVDMNLQTLQSTLQNLNALAKHMQKIQAIPITPKETPVNSLENRNIGENSLSPDSWHEIFKQQLSIMNRQLEILQLNSLSTSSRSSETEQKVDMPLAGPTTVQSKPSGQSGEVDADALEDAPYDSPLPSFLGQLVQEGEIEFATDRGTLRFPRYKSSFLAIDPEGQPGLFVENPDQIGEFWQVIGD